MKLSTMWAVLWALVVAQIAGAIVVAQWLLSTAGLDLVQILTQ